MFTRSFLRIFSPKILAIGFITLGLLSPRGHAQATEQWRSWNRPVEPFRIISNIYYVGASDITSFLIVTPQGHILLEGGFVETVPLIRANVRKLGFKESDIKLILTSHAHTDHAGGLAELKQVTGARLCASAKEVDPLARGGSGDFQWGDTMKFPPVTVDEVVADRGAVTLGGMTLTAHVTPGHTKGCTTWVCQVEDQGRKLDVVFAASLSAPGYKLVNNSAYPEILSDYQGSFVRMRSLPCDVFLAPHGFVFRLKEKMKRLAAHATPNPFIDPEAYRKFVDDSEAAIRKASEAR